MNDTDAFLIAQNFLAKEAKLLDERRFDEWFAMLDDAIVYHVPIRVAKLDYAAEHADGAYRIRDDKILIETRIKRLNSGQAWAEVPPSADDLIAVESTLLLYRQRGHDAPGEIIPVRRQDELRIAKDGAKLLKRDAFITEVVLTTPNLGVFL
jgi:hypothetical protein